MTLIVVLAVVDLALAALLLRQVRVTERWMASYYTAHDVHTEAQAGARSEAMLLKRALAEASEDALSANGLRGVMVIPPNYIGDHMADVRA